MGSTSASVQRGVDEGYPKSISGTRRLFGKPLGASHREVRQESDQVSDPRLLGQVVLLFSRSLQDTWNHSRSQQEGQASPPERVSGLSWVFPTARYRLCPAASTSQLCIS